MANFVTELTRIKRRVYMSLARMAIKGQLTEKVDDLPELLATPDTPRYRCCEYKEQAILRQRIKLALGFDPDLYKHKSIGELAEKMEDAGVSDHIVQVLSIACDRCPIDKYMVTDACRNCLAHSCVNTCPKNAIFIIDNRAFMDQSKCIECGRCYESCPFGAIHQNSRPCERSCAVDAIRAGVSRKAEINYDKCVACGNCIIGCPFGAIGDQTEIVQVVRMLKNPAEKVNAIIAPSFVGQFGVKVSPGAVKAALHQIGFVEVYEAALGADMVAMNEAHELQAKLAEGQPFMTSSCCPAFAGLVEKHFPEMADKVSGTVSPMIALARALKQEDPTSKVVFIGPCIAKKLEARQEKPGPVRLGAQQNVQLDSPETEQWQRSVDAVLTFEELECILPGFGINLQEYDPVEEVADASRHGRNFAFAGGLRGVMTEVMQGEGKGQLLKAVQVDGLANCKDVLQQVGEGKLECNFIEGMGCQGGCVGGPGSLVNGKITSRLVQNFADQSMWKLATQNDKASELKEKLAEEMEK